MNSIKQNNSNDNAPLRRDSPFNLVEEDTMYIGAMETETNDTSHQLSANSSQEAKTQNDIDSETIQHNIPFSSMRNSSVISCSSDELHNDQNEPLDYRQDWSSEIQNTFIYIMRTHDLFQNSQDETMDCDSDSIGSIDIDSVCEEEIEGPIGEWIDNEEMIW